MIYYRTENIFNREYYDEKIDFIKGFCILSVILNHCVEHLKEILFPIWGSPAVALFLIIQIFHSYKKSSVSIIKWNYIWVKIFKPFLIVQLILAIIWFFFSDLSSIDQIKLMCYSGGKGPGAYYVWVYVQIAFLIPIIFPIFKFFKSSIVLFFIVVSELSEMFFCLLHVPLYIYKLLCLRYLFLFYFGYILSTSEFIISNKTLLVSFISLLCLIIFSYGEWNFYPFFYNHPHFTTCHWPCYYFISTILLFLFVLLNGYLVSNHSKISNFICYIGKNSYTIFLAQMFYFSLMDLFPLRPFCDRFFSGLIGEIVYAIFSVCVCLFPVYLKKNSLE